MAERWTWNCRTCRICARSTDSRRWFFVSRTDARIPYPVTNYILKLVFSHLWLASAGKPRSPSRTYTRRRYFGTKTPHDQSEEKTNPRTIAPTTNRAALNSLFGTRIAISAICLLQRIALRSEVRQGKKYYFKFT